MQFIGPILVLAVAVPNAHAAAGWKCLFSNGTERTNATDLTSCYTPIGDVSTEQKAKLGLASWMVWVNASGAVKHYGLPGASENHCDGDETVFTSEANCTAASPDCSWKGGTEGCRCSIPGCCAAKQVLADQGADSNQRGYWQRTDTHRDVGKDNPTIGSFNCNWASTLVEFVCAETCPLSSYTFTATAKYWKISTGEMIAHTSTFKMDKCTVKAGDTIFCMGSGWSVGDIFTTIFDKASTVVLSRVAGTSLGNVTGQYADHYAIVNFTGTTPPWAADDTGTTAGVEEGMLDSGVMAPPFVATAVVACVAVQMAYFASGGWVTVLC